MFRFYQLSLTNLRAISSGLRRTKNSYVISVGVVTKRSSWRPRDCGSIHGWRKRYLHHSVWTDSGVNHSSYSLGTGYSFLEIKAAGASRNTTNTWTYKPISTHNFIACKGKKLIFRHVRIIIKTTISVNISACPSVSPHKTTRIPLEGFS